MSEADIRKKALERVMDSRIGQDIARKSSGNRWEIIKANKE